MHAFTLPGMFGGCTNLSTLGLVFLVQLAKLILQVAGQNGPPWPATPFNPSALPLAVRSPYLNTWLPQGTNPPQINNYWARFWSVNQVRVPPMTLHFYTSHSCLTPDHFMVYFRNCRWKGILYCRCSDYTEHRPRQPDGCRVYRNTHLIPHASWARPN